MIHKFYTLNEQPIIISILFFFFLFKKRYVYDIQMAFWKIHNVWINL